MSQFKQLIDDNVQAVITWFKNTYTDSDGFPCYDVDGNTGDHISRRNLVCEFDDYAPFFWVLGEEQYILRQYRKLAEKIRKGSLLFKRPQIRLHKGLGLPGVFRNVSYADSQDYVEIMYGLLELHELSNDPAFFETAEELFEILLKNFQRHGIIRSFRIMPFGPTFSVSDAMSGMFIEIAADMARLTSDSAKASQWLSMAEEWLDYWLNSDMFVKFGIFPSVYLNWPWNKIPGIRKKALLSELAKPNASMGYGLMALASPPFNNKTARQAFNRWIDGLHKYYMTSQCVLTQMPDLHESEQQSPVLSTNFAILDILCDAVYLFDSGECRDLAISITRYFLRYQSPETGLVPDEPGKNRSYLDANSDFAVSLAKVAEITGDSHYREAGESILKGILKYHRAEYGFLRDVDLDTGEPLSSLVETRFCSLLLKPLILYRDDLQIYGDDGKWSLFRDR
ncbi:hypothetical protein K8T06_08865 [bacterium]|nr:hypothetical protein [bacterium]